MGFPGRSERWGVWGAMSGPPMLLVEPGLPERQVVLDGVDVEAFHVRARGNDLLRRVDGDPHHLAREDVLHLAVELLALRLVQASPRLLDEGVDPRVGVARG